MAAMNRSEEYGVLVFVAIGTISLSVQTAGW